MISKRMMAIVAVVALAIPALGAAAPIVQPPVPERLVEGHTVFTVITQQSPTTTTATNTSRFAAAAAVLVREVTNNPNNELATRFPGVLWFNDQYLVDPSYSAGGADCTNPFSCISYRYPCGGAVEAVNAGDPDPRVSLVKSGPVASGISGDAAGTDVLNATVTQVEGSNFQQGGDAPNGIVDLDASTVGAGFTYVESYLITDPNDHSWVIDKYTDDASSTPVWVVNTLGHPGFIPDDGKTSCDPFQDLSVLPVCGALASSTGFDQPGCAGLPTPSEGEASRTASCQAENVTGVGGFNAAGNFRDTPCRGYTEPSTNGYCYDGNAYTTGSCADPSQYPVRAYNALLYFKMEDLSQYAGGVDHSAASTDTNGCQVGTEWACPSATDDSTEGNSHPFNPQYNGANPPSTADTTNPETAMPCPYGGDRALDATNHGGSDAQVNTGDGNYCDRVHATFNVDIYFSATGRPLEQPRVFDVIDTEGSEAPFNGPGTDDHNDNGIPADD